MDGSIFDRMTKTLANPGSRRAAAATFTATGIAAISTRLGGGGDAGAKKKRCRRIGQSCGDRKKCCNTSGLVRCEEFPSTFCVGSGKPAGLRCCSQVGATCDPKFGDDKVGSETSGGNCSCCDPLFCGKQPSGKYKCQIEST
jgi:hypothetical protein